MIYPRGLTYIWNSTFEEKLKSPPDSLSAGLLLQMPVTIIETQPNFN